MQLNDKRVKVSIERTPRGGWQGYVDTLPGFCFDDGTHCRALHWYNGAHKAFKAELADYIKDDDVETCDDPECDWCHGDQNVTDEGADE